MTCNSVYFGTLSLSHKNTMKYQGVHFTCLYSLRFKIALLFKRGSLSFPGGLWPISSFMLTSFFLIHAEVEVIALYSPEIKDPFQPRM